MSNNNNPFQITKTPDTFRIVCRHKMLECKCSMIDCSGWIYDYVKKEYLKKIDNENWEEIDYYTFQLYCNRHTKYTEEIIKSTRNRDEYDVDFEEITEYKLIPQITEEIKEIEFKPDQDKYLEYSLQNNLSTYRKNNRYNPAKRPQTNQYGIYKHHKYQLRRRPQ